MEFWKDIQYERVFILFILLVLFTLFFGFLYIQTHSKITKYRVITTQLQDTDIPSYIENQQKYHISNVECKDRCDKEICTNYEIQKSNYEQCQKCASKGLCFDPFGKDCEKCVRLKSCEEAYGCDNKEPTNPVLTDCNPCWPKIY